MARSKVFRSELGVGAGGGCGRNALQETKTLVKITRSKLNVVVCLFMISIRFLMRAKKRASVKHDRPETISKIAIRVKAYNELWENYEANVPFF